jgi:hypothetical protein
MDWTEDPDPVHPALAYHRVQQVQWSPGVYIHEEEFVTTIPQR